MDRLVIGLGNPGPEHEGTRHNAGFLVLDRIARHEGLIFEPAATLDDWSGPGDFLHARLYAPDALLVKPTTWMNRSGDVVAPLMRWAGLEPADVLVVVDDMDLPPGRLRLRPGGGSGGQKGLQSVIEALGTDRFPRLRVGIGPPATDAVRHVLTRFTPDEQPVIDAALVEAGEALMHWMLWGDIEKCMTRFHSRWNQGPASPAEDAGPHDAPGATGEKREDEANESL